jgi:hypothetical protein
MENNSVKFDECYIKQIICGSECLYERSRKAQ